ncbi:hypothetical protein SORBI_3006G255200 [Sorghum bicolor]|uniref:Uncharacterized protein n=1 Tax=Sorghum bicolor TaxID=4558 RepID=A0A1B6PNW0_SORBI|nr:hypothetical protein SORBI_3006G255200 [Sorghum bicolor]
MFSSASLFSSAAFRNPHPPALSRLSLTQFFTLSDSLYLAPAVIQTSILMSNPRSNDKAYATQDIVQTSYSIFQHRSDSAPPRLKQDNFHIKP